MNIFDWVIHSLVKHAAVEDAPNYRPASDERTRCGTCKYFSSEQGGRGDCERYNFTCHEDMVCDGWEPVE